MPHPCEDCTYIYLRENSHKNQPISCHHAGKMYMQHGWYVIGIRFLSLPRLGLNNHFSTAAALRWTFFFRGTSTLKRFRPCHSRIPPWSYPKLCPKHPETKPLRILWRSPKNIPIKHLFTASGFGRVWGIHDSIHHFIQQKTLNQHDSLRSCSVYIHCWRLIFGKDLTGLLSRLTPPKFNIAPEKWWLEDEFPFGIAYF